MEITLDRVTRSYARTHDRPSGVAGLSLAIRDGEFVTVMGPSGAGKSTILHLINGTLLPDSGRVLFDGRDVTRLPPEDRPVHTVFQGLHLFPHLDVERNVAFALERARGGRPPRAEIRERVARLLGQVGLEGLGRRAVGALSGGERQRVAIARALIDGPEALLLDEPFAPLDRSLRETLIDLILSLKRRLGITIVLTTHDWYEALRLSDRIAVIERGRVSQVGTPEELYHRPLSSSIARLTGPVNVLTGRLEDGRFLPGPGGTWGIRPAFVRLEGDLEATVEDATFAGDAWHARLRFPDGTTLVAEAREAPPRGAPVRCGLPPEHLFPLGPDA